MERTFNNYNQTLKIDSKLLDKVFSVYDSIRTNDSKISVITDLKWNDNYKITRESFLYQNNSYQAIVGKNALVVTIENCPGIDHVIHTHIVNPMREELSKHGNPRFFEEEWTDDTSMTVADSKETTTYILKHLIITDIITNSERDMIINFDSAHTFASRTFKD